MLKSGGDQAFLVAVPWLEIVIQGFELYFELWFGLFYFVKHHNIYVLCGSVVEYNFYIQGVPGGKVNILGGHSIGHSKQKTLYEHVSYSERFPR
jgi:hypothetical protein